MLKQEWLNKTQQTLLTALARYRTPHGWSLAVWLWALTLITVFIFTVAWRFTQLTAVDLTFLYCITMLLLWYGATHGLVRLLGWGILGLSVLTLLLHRYSENPAQNLVLGILLNSRSAINWAALLSLVALLAGLAGSGQVVRLLYASLFMAILTFLLRWHESWLPGEVSGQIPLAGDYDVLLLLFGTMTGLVVHYSRVIRPGIGYLLPLALLALSLYGFQPAATLLPPPVLPGLQHFWLKIHVPAMVLAWGALFMAGTTGLVFTWQVRRDGGETITVNRGQLEEVMYRLLALGVMALSVGLLAGLIWSDQLWGHYLIREPKQAGTIALWFYFLAALHQRLRKNGRALPVAYWLIAGTPLLLFVAFGIDVWFEGRHSFIPL